MSVLEHPSLVQVPLGDKFSLVLEANGHHVLLVLEPVGLKDSGLFVIMGPNREVELDGSGLFMSLFSFFLVLGCCHRK